MREYARDKYEWVEEDPGVECEPTRGAGYGTGAKCGFAGSIQIHVEAY